MRRAFCAPAGPKKVPVPGMPEEPQLQLFQSHNVHTFSLPAGFVSPNQFFFNNLLGPHIVPLA
jgi:hypothetical protein